MKGLSGRQVAGNSHAADPGQKIHTSRYVRRDDSSAARSAESDTSATNAGDRTRPTRNVTKAPTKGPGRVFQNDGAHAARMCWRLVRPDLAQVKFYVHTKVHPGSRKSASKLSQTMAQLQRGRAEGRHGTRWLLPDLAQANLLPLRIGESSAKVGTKVSRTPARDSVSSGV